MAVGDSYKLDVNGNYRYAESDDAIGNQDSKAKQPPPAKRKPVAKRTNTTPQPTPDPTTYLERGALVRDPKVFASTPTSVLARYGIAQDARSYNKAYYNSPMFKERYKTSWGEPVKPELVNDINRRLDTASVRFATNPNDKRDSYWSSQTGVFLNPKADLAHARAEGQNYADNMLAPTAAHEFRHEGDLYNKMPSTLTKTIASMQSGKNLNAHDKDVKETAADIQAMRYTLNRLGIYDAGTQVFNADHLKRYEQELKRRGMNDYYLTRLRRIYGTDAKVIWLMNKIAKNEEGSTIPDNYA
jgi:hypothetical protein